VTGALSASLLGDLARAVGQMADPRFRRVIWRGLGLAAVLLVAFDALFWWGLTGLGWGGFLLGWGSVLLLGIASVFLMIPVAAAIVSLFLDEVAAAVEAECYPGLPAVQGPGLGAGLADAARFLGLLVLANGLAFALYLMLPPLAPVIFVALNGFLLGREYFEVAAARRLGRQAATRLRRRHRGEIWLAGCLMALPLSVPLLNLVVPVLGAAVFTHTFHRLAARDA
jgi:CysZ protein